MDVGNRAACARDLDTVRCHIVEVDIGKCCTRRIIDFIGTRDVEGMGFRRVDCSGTTLRVNDQEGVLAVIGDSETLDNGSAGHDALDTTVSKELARPEKEEEAHNSDEEDEGVGRMATVDRDPFIHRGFHSTRSGSGGISHDHLLTKRNGKAHQTTKKFPVRVTAR